jgi:Divergent InlB B-repeat domain
VKRSLLPVLALLVLTLGVGNAGGRSLANTTVMVSVVGKGTVTSADSGIKCGNGKKACYIVFSGSTETLTASPASGWSFDHWDDNSAAPDCDLDITTTCDVTLNGGTHELVANFTKPATTTNTLSVTYSPATAPGGEVTGGAIDCGTAPGTDCSWTVPSGSTLTVLETPDTGNVFTGWGGACSGTGTACTVEMSGDQSVSAAWADATETAFLTVNVTGSGKVKGNGINCPSTCSATEPLNSTVTLTATPNDGSAFTGWTGVCASSAVTTCTFTMTGDTEVTATFAPAVPLTLEVTGNGNVSGGTGAINCGLGANICSANFALNASVTLIATPGTGASFTGWTGACGGSATTCTVSMSAAKSVTATFTGGAVGTGFQLSVSVSGNGRVTGGGINCGLGSAACSANQTTNSTVTLTATPDSGATFTGWGGACSGTSTTCAVVMSSAKSVTATFAGGTSTVQLTVSVTGNGTVSGGGINCGTGAFTCSASIALGSSVTLSATPASGAKFTGWGGSCSGTATTCSLVMSTSRSVTATFTTGATPGTLTIVAAGRGSVSTTAGKCATTGPKKTCVQHFAPGKKVVLTATPLPGAKFLGWGGDCSGQKPTCTVTLTTARAVSAAFSGGGTVVHAGLSSLGAPVVKRTGTGFRVTLRFNTTVAGVAHVRGLRAGRVATSLSFRVAAGRAVVGPFPVAKGGLYSFELTLSGRSLRWATCLGRCGAAAPGPPFLLTREPPVVTRSGDVWSVTLHLRANQIADDRVRAYRGTRLLVNQHFLGHAGRIVVGPFLLGPGSYTLRVTATDAYGRTRTLTWIVALAR